VVSFVVGSNLQKFVVIANHNLGKAREWSYLWMVCRLWRAGML